MQTDQKLEVLEYIEDNDIRFLRLQFTDLEGQLRNIAISPSQFKRSLKTGFPFRSSAVCGYEGSDSSDLLLMPLPETISLLPWRPTQGSVAKLFCEIQNPDGSPSPLDARQILKTVVEKAKKEGYQFKISVKLEFYLFDLDDEGKPTRLPSDEAGYFDLAPLDRGENVRREIILTLEDMGFTVESSHHEAGSGQHEIDFTGADPVSCADNIQTFKTVVKTVARLNGLHASFMPKPLNEEPGCGMHIMLSMFEELEDAFRSQDGEVLSPKGNHFCAGIMRRFSEITAVTNPIVNSYKRLAGGFIAPSDKKWRPKEDDCIIRVPDLPMEEARIILRSPDPAANPYYVFALMLAAGLEGVHEELNPKDFENEPLPKTLDEAVARMRDSSFVRSILGDELTERFSLVKKKEWDDYLATVHDWEIERYLNTI